MATMIDIRPTYEGEAKVWDSFDQNLPDEVIVYNGQEIQGREFDFCLLMNGMGIVIVEVKGWSPDSILDVAGVDNITIAGYDKPQRSPKKQARAYCFRMLNLLNDKLNVSPLIMDVVCYPFLSREQFYEKRLDIVSDESLTIFKEDLKDTVRLCSKLADAYNLNKGKPHAPMNDELIGKIRQHFEPHFHIKSSGGSSAKVVYSVLTMYKGRMKKKQVNELVTGYFAGTKTLLFVDSEDTAESILYALEDELNERKIGIVRNNLTLQGDDETELQLKDNCFRMFNFELYVIEELTRKIAETVVIYEGCCSNEEKELIRWLSKNCSFNAQQFFVEHSAIDKNVFVRAGAGTGKTYSMVSRVSYLCNKYENPIVNLIDDLAMVTFTNDAADNMKIRLKQLFVNYFVLTKNPKYLRYIEDTDFMRISTIHKFARDIIKEMSMHMGLGDNFGITSGDYAKELIYEKYLNQFIEKMEQENKNFINEIRFPLYQFKKMLVDFSNQLYNKSIDVKAIKAHQLGQSPAQMPFFNDIIMDVIVAAEKEYKENLQESNKIDLRETMILLNEVVNLKDREKTHLAYSYIFIDEFQDTDDAQIDSFLKIQKLIGEHCHLFVVGDLKQSIYRFRGASTSAFRHLGATAETWEEHELNTNYRTDSRLLEQMDEIFQGLAEIGLLPYAYATDHLTSRLYAGAADDELLQCVEYHSRQGTQMKTLVELLLKEKENILKLEQQRKLSAEEKTVAILVRKNWQIDAIVKGCKEIDASIEIETKVGGDLYQLDSAMDFGKLLLALTNPDEPMYLANLIESNHINLSMRYQSLHGCDRETQRKQLTDVLDSYLKEKLDKTWWELVMFAQAQPVLVVLKKIYEALKPWQQYSRNPEKQRFYRSNYELLIEKIIKAYSVDYLTLTVIAQSMKINIMTRKQEMARRKEEDVSGIRFLCSTVHKAKGLEYGTVILPFTFQDAEALKEGSCDVNCLNDKVLYSIKVSENQKDTNSNYNAEEESGERLCEEARILYVALTRAIRNCVWMKDVDSRKCKSWSSFLEV